MIIRSTRVWLQKSFRPAALSMADGNIEAVLPYESTCDRDYGDAMILPGLIDIHTHGDRGLDAFSGKEAIREWAENEPLEGVTCFLPTTFTERKEMLLSALRDIHAVKTDINAERRKGIVRGAEIPGAHLEGPFINAEFKGAQDEENILVPEKAVFDEFMAAAEGDVSLMTVAAEKGLDIIRYAASLGVRISMGHSAATYDEAMAGIGAGATNFTHTFNGMSPLHHRKPGMVGAALDSDVFSEIIGDGLHVEFPAIRSFFKCKGEDRGILVTDSLLAKHGERGKTFLFGRREAVVNEKGLCVFTDNGTIVGSILPMNVGLGNLVRAGVPLVSAVQAATLNPARLLGLDKRKGLLEEGRDADLVVLDDDFNVMETFCMGVPQLTK